MRIGIICPSDVAFRRFMPSLQKIDNISFVGLGVCTKKERFGDADVPFDSVKKVLNAEHEKAQKFIDSYGGKIFEGYETIATSPDIDALYIPLPPALHFRWAKLALENGKHVLVEKPSTLTTADTASLVDIARKNHLALHEDYMFVYHNQLDAIDEIIKSGEIGDARLYRISFGFPLRAANDFRYNKTLGGGALIDACGYTIKYATRLLGPSVKIRYAQMNNLPDYEVDMYGSGALSNDAGAVAQIAYGMDNNYKCELEAWGSKGCLTTGRILTAPTGFAPSVTIRKGNEDEVRELPADDAFKKSIEYFIRCIEDDSVREKEYADILKQAKLVDDFRRLAETNGAEV